MLLESHIRLVLFLLLLGQFCRLAKGEILYGLVKNISDWIRKNIATEFDLSLIILTQFCPRASFPQGLSYQNRGGELIYSFLKPASS